MVFGYKRAPLSRLEPVNCPIFLSTNTIQFLSATAVPTSMTQILHMHTCSSNCICVCMHPFTHPCTTEHTHILYTDGLISLHSKCDSIVSAWLKALYLSFPVRLNKYQQFISVFYSKMLRTGRKDP
jgi:hypothetical protein